MGILITRGYLILVLKTTPKTSFEIHLCFRNNKYINALLELYFYYWTRWLTFVLDCVINIVFSGTSLDFSWDGHTITGCN